MTEVFKEFMNSPDEFTAFHQGVKDGVISFRFTTKKKKLMNRFNQPNWEDKEAHYYAFGIGLGTVLQLFLAFVCGYLAKDNPAFYKLLGLFS